MRSHPTTGAPRAEWPLAIGMVALCAVLFCSFLGSNRALTAHEALLAATAKQMVVSGDWLVPRIGDHTWLEKPPLPQWLSAALAVGCGNTFNEWTMRLPFAIAGILVVLLTVRTATLLFNREIGWLSGVIQATSVATVMYARLAESDMLLLAFFMAGMTLFLEVETQRDRLNSQQIRRLQLAFWVMVGCTNLAKGLVFGAALLVFTCAGWLVMKRDWSALRRWFSPVGIVLAMAIAVAWPVAVIVSDPDALELWKRHLFGRAAGTLGYTQPFWYYLIQWPTQLLPWTPFLFLATPTSWKAAKTSAGPDRFCWWWFLGQMALLSCSSGKHHHYLLYALPAMSPIIAQGVLLTAEWLRDPSRSWNLTVLGLAFVAGLIMTGGMVLGLQLPETRLEAWFFVPLLGSMLGVLAWQIHQRWTRPAWSTLVTLILMGHLYAQVIVMPRVDTSAADKRFIADVDAQVDPATALSTCGSQEMSLPIFYLRHPVVSVWKPQDLLAALPQSDQFYVVARGYDRKSLATLGRVEQIIQSTFTRRERSPEDRFTLFRVSKFNPQVAATQTTLLENRSSTVQRGQPIDSKRTIAASE